MLQVYRVIRNLLTSLVGGVLLAVAGEFAIEAAREHGLYSHPTKILGAAMDFLRSQLWFWPCFFLLFGLVAGLWIDSFMRRRTPPAEKPVQLASSDGTPPLAQNSPAGQEEKVDPEIYNLLVNFSLDTLLPVCSSRMDLTREIIEKASSNPAISYLADACLRGHTETAEFHRAYYEMDAGLRSTAGAVIPFSELVELIHVLESGAYKQFRDFGDALATQLDINPAADGSKLRPLWETWYSQNDALIAEYEKIKRDSRIPRLFRPGKESRWGGSSP